MGWGGGGGVGLVWRRCVLVECLGRRAGLGEGGDKTDEREKHKKWWLGWMKVDWRRHRLGNWGARGGLAGQSCFDAVERNMTYRFVPDTMRVLWS